MRIKKSILYILLALVAGGTGVANAEEQQEKSLEEYLAEAKWECKIDDNSFELVLVNLETGLFKHTIKDNGHEICSSDDFMSECNNSFIETPYYYYKRGKIVDNSQGNRLYRICRVDVEQIYRGKDDKLEEQAEYEAKGGTRW